MVAPWSLMIAESWPPAIRWPLKPGRRSLPVAALPWMQRFAANAVLGVTEPMMNGIGGDLFLLYWDAKNGKLYGLNASGWAPQGLTITFLNKQGVTSMPEDGIHSVTVPGAVDGWAKAHQRFGRLAWKDLFAPAIYYAENGYAVPEIIHDFWIMGRDRLKQTREAERVFLLRGKTPEVGEKFSNTDLGKTLR